MNLNKIHYFSCRIIYKILKPPHTPANKLRKLTLHSRFLCKQSQPYTISNFMQIPVTLKKKEAKNPDEGLVNEKISL